MIPIVCKEVENFYECMRVVSFMASKVSEKKIDDELDYSLNDLMLRGRVSAQAVEKELPSGARLLNFDSLSRDWSEAE
jgi:hypothetical protein